MLACCAVVQRGQHLGTVSSVYTSMSSPTAFAGKNPITVGRQPLLLDQGVEHRWRRRTACGRSRPRPGVEDVGEPALHLQALKNGCQSMYSRSSASLILELRTPIPRRAPLVRSRPTRSCAVRAGLLQRQHRPLVLLGAFAQGCIVVSVASSRLDAACRRGAQQRPHRAGRVLDPDHRTTTTRRHLHGRVGA